MQFFLKLSIIFALFFLTSCQSDVPDLPEYNELGFCKYTNKAGESVCKSMYFITKEDCEAPAIGGEVVTICDN